MTTLAIDVPGPFWGHTPSVDRMLNVYHFVYRQYGYSFNPNHQDLIWFEWLGATGRLTGYLKWKTANILARASGSLDRVPCPMDSESIPPLFDYYLRDAHLGLLRTDQGFYRMKLHRTRTGRDDRFVRFCFSLYQSKSASLPAPSWEIQEAVRSTETRICADKAVDGTIMTPRGVLTEDHLLAELDRTVDEIFPHRAEEPAKPRMPGRGACIGSARRDGGALGYTVRWLLRYDFLPYDHFVGFFTSPNGAIPFYSSVDPEDIEWARSAMTKRSMTAGGVPCIPVGFPEPFKVRVVTMGETGVYSIARDYQPRVWSALKNHPTFQLVGEMVGPRALRHFASQLDPDRDRWIISGDYQQATDHIPSYLSERVMERICFRLGVPAEMIPSLLVSLTRHVLRDGREQASGQLMGSPSSFPVLCVLNAAFSRLAYEWSHGEPERKYLDEIPMLVNGDDLLLGGDLSLFLTWKRVVGWAGLRPSVGKTLVSERYGTINSTLYRFDTSDGYVKPSHLPHLQLQLALGSMKSGQYDVDGKLRGINSPSSQSRMWSDFMASSPHPARAWSFLYSANRAKIKELCSLYPDATLCLAPEAGGLGLPLPPQDSPYYAVRTPRAKHLMLARLLLEEGTPEHHLLRARWLALLGEADSAPSERILFRWVTEHQRKLRCPLLRVDATAGTRVPVPPPEWSYYVATAAQVEQDLPSESERRATSRSLLKALKAWSLSGRGPWTVARVSAFLRDFRWIPSYGSFSSRTASDMKTGVTSTVSQPPRSRFLLTPGDEILGH